MPVPVVMLAELRSDLINLGARAGLLRRRARRHDPTELFDPMGHPATVRVAALGKAELGDKGNSPNRAVPARWAPVCRRDGTGTCANACVA